MMKCFIVQILPVIYLLTLFWRLAVLLSSICVCCIVSGIIQTMPHTPPPQWPANTG